MTKILKWTGYGTHALGFVLFVLSQGLLLNIPKASADAPYLASDVLGQSDFTSNSVNYGLGSTNARGLDYPTSTIVDTVRHRLFVGEGDGNNNRILVFNLDVNNILVDKSADYVIGQSDLTSNAKYNPTQNSFDFTYGDMGYDSEHDRLFVNDYNGNRVLVFDLSNGITNGMNASYVLGQPDFTTITNYGPTRKSISSPFGGNAYDPGTGYLYVSDYGNTRVMVFDVDPNNIENNMDALYVIGKPNFTSNDTTASQSVINYSYGIGIDNTHHRLFVSDTGNNRILVFDLTNLSNGMNASYVLGQPSFTSTDSNGCLGCATDQSGLSQPNSVTYDSEHNLLFVADYANNRYLVFNLANIANNMDAVGVVGQPDFVSNTYTVSQTQFNFDYPEMTGYDEENRTLYVPDGYGHRILIFSFAHLKDLSATSLTVGSSFSQSLGSGYQGTTTFTLDSGSLPPGLTFNTTTGLLSGTPTSPGTFSFTLSISDDNGTVGTYTDTKSYVLGISAASTPSSSTTTIKKTLFSTSNSDATDEEVVVPTETIQETDTATAPTRNPNATPSPLPNPNPFNLSLVWWGMGGFSFLLLTVLLSRFVLKRSGV